MIQLTVPKHFSTKFTVDEIPVIALSYEKQLTKKPTRETVNNWKQFCKFVQNEYMNLPEMLRVEKLINDLKGKELPKYEVESIV